MGIAHLVAVGAMDPELGALAWLLLDGDVPVLVCAAADDPTDLHAIAAALTDPQAPERVLADKAAARRARTLRAGSLREAFAVLGAEPFNLSEDEIRSLGLVLVLAHGRVIAAHYVRPIERDAEGHLQRRPPAVLATWDEARQRWEHFSWAMTPELGARTGRTQAEFEEVQSARARLLREPLSAAIH